MKRRSFLKATLATGAASVAVSAGLLTPSKVLASWNKQAFEASTVDAALNGVFGSANAASSDDVKLTAPAIAENGAVTPITVDASGIDGVESIVIIATDNPNPLVCEYKFHGAAQGFVSTRIRMGSTQTVMGIAKVGDNLLKAEQEVRVTIGGCGG
ncbi:thiosulfate oxidation carrier protein SoxY [Thiomicrospira sp. ALE5]|uniref:thiosulfate oxidation carrier protein SoxY n=1 Tax=Thiomicrospira sp. ALE5 TaxID=748650 RepID=UPI0008E6E3D9|nr:thiosulfate oxidation carrier protein SoxY [Thiomicrospira sp. ALE5]SFR63047.1 thiosulfate-binding protein SoxY [Thiomicrospira sp. ALE5]